jgi:hypothetical protein
MGCLNECPTVLDISSFYHHLPKAIAKPETPEEAAVGKT